MATLHSMERSLNFTAFAVGSYRMIFKAAWGEGVVTGFILDWTDLSSLLNGGKTIIGSRIE